ncbi:MAG TPA: DEDD exonuclease domain-containing protein [Aeromicrobium sp.]|nr:DEDD exonuclease domain-containing protein [Aeromicrobium sp.]
MALTQQAFDDPSFDWGGRLLHETTFCVVDLETTGGSPAKGAAITEVGAVKVRGGQVLGEFATLVNPNQAIPAFITVLTGITDQMVSQAPPISEVLPAFLDFSRDTVLVAHNAGFDLGFLKHAAKELEISWPGNDVIDTVKLARRVLSRDEVPNMKLSTLSARFSSVEPDHRALTDARATVDVLHALFERLGSFNVSTVEEVAAFSTKISKAQRQKRHLADSLPDAPGVYLFRDSADEVLYVGTSKSLRKRVRTYFTSSETRSRMGEMIALAERIDHVVCTSAVEAAIRELRLIDRYRPPYNRRSKFPERVSWLRLTDEPWPRISIVRTVTQGATHLGPFTSRRKAEMAMAALHSTFQVRQCGGKLPVVPTQSACIQAEIGQCLAPCDPAGAGDQYGSEIDRLRTAMSIDPIDVVSHSEQQMLALAGDQKFEDAATERDRTAALVEALSRTQRLTSLAQEAELVAAAPIDSGWEVHVIRHGRLAATGLMSSLVAASGDRVQAWVDDLVLSAETVTAKTLPMPSALVEESELLLNWLESQNVRLIRGRWVWPWPAAGRHGKRFEIAPLPTLG